MCPGRDPGHPRLPLAAAVVVFLPLVELLRWLRAIRAFAHEAFSVVRRRPHIGGLQLQLANVRIDDREALLAQHHTIGQRNRSTSPSAPPVHGPKFLILSDPPRSPRRGCYGSPCTAFRSTMILRGKVGTGVSASFTTSSHDRRRATVDSG